MKPKKALLALAVVGLVSAFFLFDLGQYLSLEYFKAQREHFDQLYRANPWQTALVYFLIYVAVTGLSLPGAALMTLAGGAIFGLLWGTLIISFASTIGATLAFIASRFLLRDAVQNRFGNSLRSVNAGMERDGALYLFTLRLVPVFPFFVINLVMGLTPIRTLTFYLVSQAGMLAGTIVYVNAGTQIARIDSLAGILSPNLIISFALIGIFPLIAKKTVQWTKGYKAARKFSRPKKFDRNLVVIGAGSGGLVSAYIAAAVNARVTLIEKHRMGGDCLNTGCVPSKALIRSTRFLNELKHARNLGIRTASADFKFADIMARVRRVIQTIEPHDSVERYQSLGVECLQGEARIVSPYAVRVNDQTLTTRAIIIATGARPSIPPIPGIEDVGYLTSDTIWDLEQLPGRLLVLGGGPIGCELAQCFSRLGSQVIQVEQLERLLIREDPEFSELLMERFRAEGIDLRTGCQAREFTIDGDRKTLHCVRDGKEEHITFDTLLVAVGRTPNTEGFGLEELDIRLRKNGTIEVNEFLQTNHPNVYACGDVTGPYPFTHAAAHQAWYTSVNALFGGLKRFRVDYRVLPWCTFTEPEVARVGLNEQEAREKDIACEVSTFDMSDLDRAIADEEAHGMIKVLTVPGKDKILGATIAGPHAGELISEFVTAMRHGLGLNKILGTIHIYPTLSEANKYAAGVWKKAHAPQNLLCWVERYHTWRRR